MATYTIGNLIVSLEVILTFIIACSFIYIFIKQLIKKPKISVLHPAAIIGTCFNSGRMPFSPGTWGTAFSAYLFAFILFLPKKGVIEDITALSIVFGIALVSYPLGVWATDVYMKRTGKHDPKEIVIDELSGFFIQMALVIAGYSILLKTGNQEFQFILMKFAIPFFVFNFVLFRLYDITKPWHVGVCDREMDNAHGVMLDDVVAGIYGAITFFAVYFILYFAGAFHWYFAEYEPEWLGAPPVEKLY